jgi:hypothetical protein
MPSAQTYPARRLRFDPNKLSPYQIARLHPKAGKHPAHHRMTFRVLQPWEIGTSSKNYRVCSAKHYKCADLSKHRRKPWCDYYGAPLDMLEKRPARCDECKEKRGF